MNQKNKKTLMTTISVAAASLITIAVLCFTTPTKVGSPNKANSAKVLAETTMVTTVKTTIKTAESTTITVPVTTTTVLSTTISTTNEDIQTSVVETTVTATIAEVAETTNEPAKIQREFVVYKPNTHYIHKSTCHWVDSTCYEIENTNDIECRKCSECNPNLEIVNTYNEPTPVVAASNTGISDYDYELLCKIVASEYGSMADVYERAKIVASVMNMVNDPQRWPNTVEEVLDKTCAPWGFNKYNEYFCGGTVHYTTMADAVDYYFNNQSEFANWTCNQWYGDGKWNHFHTI